MLDDAMKKVVPPVIGRQAQVTVNEAKGSWLYTDDGQKWLDFATGIAVVNTGHGHPRVIAAAKEQMDRIVHAQQNMFYNETVVRAANKLLEVVPGGMDMVLFANSGAEAVENAVKLAKQATRRPCVVAFRGSFHGRTHLTMALTDSKAIYRGHFEPLPGAIYHSRYAYPFRTPASEDPVDYAMSDLHRVVATECFADDVAAILIEPIQGEGGFIVPPDQYLPEVRALATEIGALLVVDEIQTGFGRTGRWMGHEHSGIEADVVALAKGIASGFTLSAVVSRSEYFNKCKPGSMGGTYGGNAVACAASMATIDVIRDEDLLGNAERQGDRLRGFLRGLQEQYPAIGEVRGKGLMNAIEMVKPGTREPDPAATKAFAAECTARRLLNLTCGIHDNVNRFLPPLSISDAEMDHAFEVLEEAAKVLAPAAAAR